MHLRRMVATVAGLDLAAFGAGLAVALTADRPDDAPVGAPIPRGLLAPDAAASAVGEAAGREVAP